ELLVPKYVAEPLAISFDASRGRVRKMNRHDNGAGPGDFAQETPARARRLIAVPVEHGRPIRLPALQRVMHEVAGDHGTLAAGADVDAAMARRMAGRRRQPDRVVEGKVV